jgi:hypothetical protein
MSPLRLGLLFLPALACFVAAAVGQYPLLFTLLGIIFFIPAALYTLRMTNAL